MVFEIEKRVLLTSKLEFDKIKNNVAKKGEYNGSYIFKSFLFRKPEYLRIRIIKDQSFAIITKKSGTYQDLARTEIEEKIELKELNTFLSKISKKGFNECAAVKTISHSYSINGLRVDFNEIEFLGMIIEVEALTDNKTEIRSLNLRIEKVMKLLGLKELNPIVYQKMMDNLYSTLIKPVSEQKFEV